MRPSRSRSGSSTSTSLWTCSSLAPRRPGPGADGDREGVPHLHAPAGHVLRGGRDRTVPDLSRFAAVGNLPSFRRRWTAASARSPSCSSAAAAPSSRSRSSACSTSAGRLTADTPRRRPVPRRLFARPHVQRLDAPALAAASTASSATGSRPRIALGTVGLNACWTRSSTGLGSGDPARDLAREHRRSGAPPRRHAEAAGPRGVRGVVASVLRIVCPRRRRRLRRGGRSTTCSAATSGPRSSRSASG